MTRSKSSTSVLANTRYWFDGEFLNYPRASFEIKKDILPWRDRLVLINGKKTNREAYQWRANELIAEMLDVELEIFPGEHLGHMTDARLFAERFAEVLSSRPRQEVLERIFPRSPVNRCRVSPLVKATVK